MQGSIEAHAHRLHCGLDEDPALEDSVDITLRAFAEQEGWAARGGAGESGGSEDAGACADGNWTANPAMQNRMGTASVPGRDCASIIGAAAKEPLAKPPTLSPVANPLRSGNLGAAPAYTF